VSGGSSTDQQQLADDALPVVPWPVAREDSVLGLPGRDAAPARMRRRDALFRAALGASDVIAAVVPAVLCVALVRPTALRVGILLLVFITLSTAKLIGLYDRDELVFHKSTLDETPGIIQLGLVYAIVAWMLHGVFFRGTVGQREVLLLLGLFDLFDVVLRFLGRRLARSLAPPERCLVVGRATERMRLSAKLAQTHATIEVVGSLPLHEERAALVDRRGESRPGTTDRRQRDLHIEDLDGVVEERAIDRVIIIPGVHEPDEMLDSIGRAKSLGVKVSIVPRLFEVVGSSVEFDDLEGMTVLGVRRFGLTNLSRGMKRMMDLAGALVLVVLLSPVLLAIALAIKLDSRGTLFYRQPRVGLDGEHFDIVKFRSMVEGAHDMRDKLRELNESEGLFKIRHDPRITRVGRIIRRLAFDELPQLWNVLHGEMSLVGPRPLVVDEDGQVIGRHRDRLRLKPGITGPWQLLGPGRVPLNEMVTIDYLYGANWSLWNDLKILVRTVGYVVNRRGM
jgi:exopolysaccharide biosynthesis polyprenyl glycosylphosphotransferase